MTNKKSSQSKSRSIQKFEESLKDNTGDLTNLPLGLVWISKNKAFDQQKEGSREEVKHPEDVEERVAILQEKIAHLIKRSGISQEELAEKTGFQQSQISRWIGSSSKGIPIYALLSLAEYLPIKWDSLFNFVDFPVFLPESLDRAVVDNIVVGEKDQEKVSIHKKDLEGVLLILGSDRSSAREEVSLSLSVGLAQQCQPLLVVENGSGLSSRFLSEMEKKNPEMLGQIINLDFNTTSIPTNFFNITSRAEIGPAFALFRDILALMEEVTDIQALRAIEAGALALLDANLALEENGTNIFDLRKFFQDHAFRQKIIAFAQNTAAKEAFDIDTGYWERIGDLQQEEILAAFYRFLNTLESFSSGQGMFSASDNLLGKALLENIVLVRLPEEPLMARVIFALLQKELEHLSDPRFCLLDNFESYTNSLAPLFKKRNLSFLLSSDKLSETYEQSVKNHSGICFHTLPEEEGLWLSEIRGEGDMLIEKRDGNTLAVNTLTPLRVESGSPLYELQIQEYHRNWLTRKPKHSLLRSSAEEVQAASKEALESCQEVHNNQRHEATGSQLGRLVEPDFEATEKIRALIRSKREDLDYIKDSSLEEKEDETDKK